MKKNTTNSIYLTHELLEWFNCQRKSYHLHNTGCTNLIQSSFLREQIRLIQMFLASPKVCERPTYGIEGDSIEDQARLTLEAIHSRTAQRICHGLLVHNSMSVYLPFMTWHNTHKGWVCYIPTASVGIRQEHLQYASLLLKVSEALSIPVAKILLTSSNNDSPENKGVWFDFDILTKAQKYYAKNAHSFTNLEMLINSPEAEQEEHWQLCERQYCEQCGIEKKYEIDDIRTLRRAKQLITDLQVQNIEKITEIPTNLISNNAVLSRQMQAVYNNQPLVIPDEVNSFLQRLNYPRYYLDFEAFSTAVPYHYETPYNSKCWAHNPFLFSLQWQDAPQAPIHTQLWSMIPGKNQLTQMWSSLKEALSKAESIIVYGSQFEREMLQQLATAHNENQIGDLICKKLVDLQELFFNLSVYHPEQKGKISLKTVTPIWLKGQNYHNLKVNEGIGANYYFTALTDTRLELFKNISHVSYIAALFEKIACVEDESVTLKDIAQYCKYDTEVMIRMVAMLEQILA